MRENFRLDPRLYQIAALGTLLVYGLVRLDFDIPAAAVALTLGTAIATQLAFTRLAHLPRFDPKSALISALSLCLLLRSDSPVLYAVAAAVAVGTKFLVRIDGKHVFNPTNIALVVMLLTTRDAWISPGQWGSTAFFAFFISCAGMLVVYRAVRSDVTVAFLGFYVALLFGRALWLGDPLAIPILRLENGALLLFAFFMISDPKTTPDSRAARILFAALVALFGWWIQVKLFRSEGLLFALALLSPAVPLLDRLMPGSRYDWAAAASPVPVANIYRLAARSHSMRTTVALLLTFLLGSSDALAFCGFYVAKADTKLFNKASQVAIVRDGNRTVMTMANDFRGEMKEFAIVIPVPTFIERKQINVAEKALLDHLDAYSSPRLVEYFDDDPCAIRPPRAPMPTAAMDMAGSSRQTARAKSLGVKIEAQYTVGEYDILILSAKESGGLLTWLVESGYKLPAAAGPILGSYIKQNMRFFVARVNLEQQSKLGFTYLRPIQVAYDSPKFMLPIRLGTLNADGPQELFIYTLTRRGRVETTNYRTVRLPTGAELPVYVKNDFANFYKAMFSYQVKKEEMRTLFTEYAWDMAWCDPCAAEPLSNEELRKLGVFWVPRPTDGDSRRPVMQGVDVFLTRLHVRYDAAHFPEDLMFQETGDRSNFQARYVLRHPWKGDASCKAAQDYRQSLKRREEAEVIALAQLTGWDVNSIRRKANLTVANPPKTTKPKAKEKEKSWWDDLWD